MLTFNDVMTFVSLKKLGVYISDPVNRKLDLLFYLVFIFQTAILTSIPTGFHSPNEVGWYEYFFRVGFYLLFYPFLKYKFYKNNGDSFIREVVILSVVAKIKSFLWLALVALLQITIWRALNLPKIPGHSMIFFVLFYILFSINMISAKRILINNAV